MLSKSWVASQQLCDYRNCLDPMLAKSHPKFIDDRRCRSAEADHQAGMEGVYVNRKSLGNRLGGISYADGPRRRLRMARLSQSAFKPVSLVHRASYADIYHLHLRAGHRRLLRWTLVEQEGSARCRSDRRVSVWPRCVSCELLRRQAVVVISQ